MLYRGCRYGHCESELQVIEWEVEVGRRNADCGMSPNASVLTPCPLPHTSLLPRAHHKGTAFGPVTLSRCRRAMHEATVR